MIDTVKIYCEVSKEISQKIKSKSVVKSPIDYATGDLQYEITNGHLLGSYDTKLSVRTDYGEKYHLFSKGGGYYVEIEGSYHKITKGYNSHDGIYCLSIIIKGFVEMAENAYDIKLPAIEDWYLQRIDIAKCYDLQNQGNVINYLLTLGRCRYPRRKVQPYSYGGINIAGTTTTLKIYNKYLEFQKHDLKRFKDTDFDIVKYCERIQGFIRFEVEIKKKMLQKMYGEDLKHISVVNLKYEDFEKIWSDEFMRLLGMIKNDLKIVRGKEEVKKRLLFLYSKSKAMRLFNFYCAIQLNGIDFVKEEMTSSTYYRSLSELKSARIDYSQTYKVEEDSNIFYFNPFECEEVA